MRILICDSQKIVIELITDIVRELAGSGTEVEVDQTCFDHEIADLVLRKRFDMVLVTTNNIVHSSGIFQGEDPVGRQLSLVRYLKKVQSAPIIVSFGFPQDPQHRDRLLEAGAAFALRMPWKVDDFRNEVRKSIPRWP